MAKSFYLLPLFQSIMKESYDHHAAIYFLLLDKLREQRSSPAATLASRTGAESAKRRRPSTIAEQPGKVMTMMIMIKALNEPSRSLMSYYQGDGPC